MNGSSLKKGFLYSLLCVAVVGIGHLLYLYTHREFKPDQFSHPFILTREGPATSQAEVSHILKQTFVYCGHGKQMTAFESEDGRYILKLFNPRPVLKKSKFRDYKRLKRLISLKWISHAYFKKRERLEKLFKRYEIGFDHLREESGLVYVHLSASTELNQPLQLIDQKGKSYTIDLKQTPFVLQKKAILVFAYLDKLLQQGEVLKAKEAVLQLRNLFVSRAKKGYTDRIQTLHNNYGFVDGQAIQIDLGRIVKDEIIQLSPEKEIKRVVCEMKETLVKRYPDL